MPDVFVSYAREDREQVRRVDDALQVRGFDTWVDWDILPSADWMSEVESAITGSDAFLFALSPDSLRSPMCRRELDHATQLRKRIVPVVLRDVDAELVPENVRSLNWVFCRTADEFDSAVDALRIALALDFDWVHDHTRLLVRSIDWETHERDVSRLLRGRDLVAAEQ